jgi:hypothetical protein
MNELSEDDLWRIAQEVASTHATDGFSVGIQSGTIICILESEDFIPLYNMIVDNYPHVPFAYQVVGEDWM